MPPPTSTYRLQISARFSLFDAAERVPYLAALGVGAVYVSPLLRSSEGSEHGYDVVDHRAVDGARGGDAGLVALGDACRTHGLGLVVDIVPNHMGVAVPSENAAWWDLLAGGRAAPTAGWFDVDWASEPDRVVLPVLDLAGGEPDVVREGDTVVVAGVRYPLAPPAAGPDQPVAAVLERQHYRLVDHRTQGRRLNYRRFFAVTGLAGLRVEDPSVYLATHREVLRWVGERHVTGLRVDHPDGLDDPAGYLDRLATDAPRTWITVEKITGRGEHLPGWRVAGTTGYDALAEVNRLLVDPDDEEGMDAVYRRVTGDERSWSAHAAESKAWAVDHLLGAELDRLARLVGDGPPDVAAALGALAVAFPVYRSYLPEGADALDEAVRRVSAGHPRVVPTLRSLLPRLSNPADELCRRFQQYTGAVMAKGVEDTAFYRYTRLVSLNEVGGDPGLFGSTLDEFHDRQADRLARSRAGMTTLSTHDTKRGEDVRARIAVLGELPDAWRVAVETLMTLVPLSDRPFAHLLWQTFVGAGVGADAVGRERMQDYARKAMREAAVSTSWDDPQPAFERSVHAAVDAAYDQADVRRQLGSLGRRVAPPGRVNALAQKLVQLTMPGVPDVYQGCEVQAASLVDPDNRRPVDFDGLAQRLADVDAASPGPPPSDPKLWLTARALRARRDRPDLFAGYEPLRLGGRLDRHLVAFDRGGAVTAATRLPVRLDRAGGWGDARLVLPTGRFVDVLTGARHQGRTPVGALFVRLPCALLVPQGAA